MSEYRGESKPRRSPARHHVQVNAGLRRTGQPTDPFPPISSAQFPALYTRNPVKNVYRRYMRSKSPYLKRN